MHTPRPAPILPDSLLWVDMLVAPERTTVEEIVRRALAVRMRTPLDGVDDGSRVLIG